VYIKSGRRYRPARPNEILDAAAELLVDEQIGKLTVVSAPRDTVDLLRMLTAGRGYDNFVALFLDTRHRVIAAEELFRGTIDGAAVYPREVARRALELSAAAVVFAHAHPSGVAEPSEADRAITQKLVRALALLEIRVLDHIILTNTAHISLAEQGLL
jgi:DNA repair protein RadC